MHGLKKQLGFLCKICDLLIFQEASYILHHSKNLQYEYNSAHTSGKKNYEIVEMVKIQPKNVPFDYDFNTVEGKSITITKIIAKETVSC